MMTRALMLTATMVSLAFAGCIGGSAEPVDSATTDEAGGASVPEGRGRILAFEETNRTETGSGGVDHPHDMWNGLSRKTLLEQTVTFTYPTSTNLRVATVKPEKLDLVPEGPATVEVTLSEPRRSPCFLCPPVPDPAGAGGLMLLYKHAATVEWIEVGATTWSTPTIITITNPVQTDMPHATHSLWTFMLRTDDAKAGGLTFDIKVDLVRGDDDIPNWPGHPAFYVDSPVRRILDVDAIAGEEGIVGGNTGGAQPTGPIHPEKVVSYETRTLYVYVNVSNLKVASPIDEPTTFYLIHRNASGEFNHTDYFDVEGKHAVSKSEHLWILRVDEDGMDSPYADGSRWEFELAAAFARNTPVLYTTCYRGCATWTADYHITILATNQILEDEAYG